MILYYINFENTFVIECIFLLFKINDVIICCQKERNTLFINGGQYMNKNEITKIVLSELLEEFYPKDKKKIDWMGASY